MTRPSDALIMAWAARVKLKREAHRAERKAEIMFKVDARRRPDVYRQADKLAKLAVAMDACAEREFRQALAKEYGTRFDLQLLGTTAVAWVHAPYEKELEPVRFNSALRLRNKGAREVVRTASRAVKLSRIRTEKT